MMNAENIIQLAESMVGKIPVFKSKEELKDSKKDAVEKKPVDALRHYSAMPESVNEAKKPMKPAVGKPAAKAKGKSK